MTDDDLKKELRVVRFAQAGAAASGLWFVVTTGTTVWYVERAEAGTGSWFYVAMWSVYAAVAFFAYNNISRAAVDLTLRYREEKKALEKKARKG